MENCVLSAGLPTCNRTDPRNFLGSWANKKPGDMCYSQNTIVDVVGDIVPSLGSLLKVPFILLSMVVMPGLDSQVPGVLARAIQIVTFGGSESSS